MSRHGGDLPRVKFGLNCNLTDSVTHALKASRGMKSLLRTRTEQYRPAGTSAFRNRRVDVVCCMTRSQACRNKGTMTAITPSPGRRGRISWYTRVYRECNAISRYSIEACCGGPEVNLLLAITLVMQQTATYARTSWSPAEGLESRYICRIHRQAVNVAIALFVQLILSTRQVDTRSRDFTALVPVR
jgi:hypothetical protein